MEYLVTMTTHVPDGTSEEAVADVRAREAAHTRELAAQGHILRLWRPPLAPGEWRTLGLFVAADRGELEQIRASMPLRVRRSDEVTELARHPNDPVVSVQRPPRPAVGETPWLTKEITPLVPHPNDPAVSGSRPATAQAGQS
jgi:muconolactone delta-isomerase